MADSLFAYFVELYTPCVVAQPEDLFQVPADSLSLSVRVGCEVDFIRFFYLFFKSFYYGFFVGGYDVIRLIIFSHVHAEAFFGEIPDVSAAGVYLVLAAEIFFYGLRLRGRFHDYKLHISLRYPVIPYSVPSLLIRFLSSSIETATDIS